MTIQSAIYVVNVINSMVKELLSNLPEKDGELTSTEYGLRLIVVVLYRSSASELEIIAELLRKWLAMSATHRASIIENSNNFEAVEYLTESLDRWPRQLIVTTAQKNLGFSPGVNTAVSSAVALWAHENIQAVCLVNPDLKVDADVIAQLCDKVVEGNLGVASPLVRTPTGETDRGCARRFWTRRMLIAELVGTPKLAGVLGGQLRNIEVDSSKEVWPVDICTGACMVIRYEVFGSGLDTGLPMYLEDQEICHRAKLRGLRVAVLANFSALHVGGQSRKRNVQQARTLRLLELVDAPTLSFKSTGHLSHNQARIIVGISGIARALFAVGGYFARRRKLDRQWLSDQLVLARWFVEWALYDHDATLRSKLQ